MSEYVHDWAVSRLIGPQPGYVGYTEPEQWLTSRIRATPNTVLLLDEIEKAHPSVRNVFLQAFDAGRLTDGRGAVASFSDVIVVMTSNLGAEAFRATTPVGFVTPSSEDLESEAESAVVAAMPPELVNRLDAIVVFRPLERTSIEEICRKTIDQALARLGDRGFDLTVDHDVVSLVADQGFDVAYGARNLRRAVERLLLEPLLAGHAAGVYQAVLKEGAIQWVESSAKAQSAPPALR
jgi:ATP-dependent Clp protease ATP-binding subunit ClpA